MTRADLIEEVARVIEISRRDAEYIVETVLGCITEAVSQGDKVELRGFGSFRTRKRRRRIARNPKSGERVESAREENCVLQAEQGSARDDPVQRILTGLDRELPLWPDPDEPQLHFKARLSILLVFLGLHLKARRTALQGAKHCTSRRVLLHSKAQNTAPQGAFYCTPRRVWIT